MKIIRRLLAATVLTLAPATAFATVQYVSGLTLVGSVSATDTFYDCALNNCGVGTLGNRATALQLDTYILGTLSASSPLAYSAGAFSLTGTVGVANGGTGLTTWTAAALPLGNGSSAPTFLSPVNGDCAVGAGGVWTVGSCGSGSSAFSALTSSTNTTAAMVVGSGASLSASGGTITATAMPASGLTGQVAVANGGTGLASLTAGTLSMGAGTSPFVASEITDISSGGVVIGSPTGGQKGAGTINMTGCFINNVACASGSSTAFSALTGGTNTSAAMVVGTGASLAVSGSGTIVATSAPLGGLTGLGTGVATALGIAPGTTGSFATQDGAITTGNCLKWGPGVQDNGSACGGGGTPVSFTGTTTGSANTYALTTVPSSGLVLANQPVIEVAFNAANTGASTINVNAGGAVAIDTQTSSGLSALVGGEIVAGNTMRTLQYNATAAVWVLKNQLGAPVLNPCTSQTFTAAQWTAGLTCVVTSASQTFTFPVVTGLSPQGGIFLNSISQYFTVTPNSADGINGGTINTSAIFGPGFYQVSTPGTSGTTALAVAGGGPAIPIAISWLPGMNLAAAALPIANLKSTYGWMISQITCTPEVVAGGTATIDLWEAPSGTALGEGTKLTTTPCNANTGAGTDQALLSAPVTVPAGDRIGIIATGAGFTSSPLGAGVLTVTLQQ